MVKIALRIEGRTDKNKLVKHQIMKMTKDLVWATCCFNNAHASKMFGNNRDNTHTHTRRQNAIVKQNTANGMRTKKVKVSASIMSHTPNGRTISGGHKVTQGQSN